MLLLVADDLDTMEALAVTYAKGYDFDKASELLEKLVAAKPGDVEAWRLLGETSLLSAKAGKAVQAYESAVGLRKEDLQIVTVRVEVG